ncbi:MAG TPA: sigma-70 family RNA polymerase sigma factor [Candidatus Binatia bacterium]
MTAPSEEHGNREAFLSAAGRHLKELYAFVRRQLSYRESLGDLAPGELAVEDVVDAALIRAYREYAKQPPGDDLADRLKRLAARQIENEIRRLRPERERAVHVEEDVPETPPEEEVRDLGEGILYFYQPDEDLKAEDVLPDLRVPTPEQAAEALELRECFRKALAALPRDWREALRLRYVVGLSGASLAKALRRSERESERIVEEAAHYLRQRLLESGCEFNPAAGQIVLPLENEAGPRPGPETERRHDHR